MPWQKMKPGLLVREVLKLGPDDPLPQDIYAVGSSSGTKYRISLHYGPSGREGRTPDDEEYYYVDDNRRVYAPGGEADSEIDWDAWRDAMRDWRKQVQDAASKLEDRIFEDERVYSLAVEDPPDPNNFYEVGDDPEDDEYCCQVDGSAVSHFDWAVSMYLHITADEERWLGIANKM